ncbi:MAG: hypothetical protein KME08_10870 [Aphanothece sp. CMT-3BRIN-NPC111]|jgi:hypothetical protein|nr:hypothetical protein [Aphanothece sp. CMT-3BRIN-NPC111]
MSAEATLPRSRKGYITSSNLVLLAFATAFFPRVLAGLGAPSTINFLHFATIPFVCGFVLSKVRFKDPNQLSITTGILFNLAALLTVMTASALLNSAGLINVILDFMLLGEPFILLLAIVCIPMSPASLEQFRTQWMRFALANLLFALCQSLILRLDSQNADLIKGVFVGQGSGHVVGASVSMTFAVYYFATAKNRPTWIRASIVMAVFVHIIKADAKQLLAVFLGALLISILLKAKDIGKLIQYLVIACLFVGLIVLLANTVFRALLIWADLDIQRQGIELKLVGFSILPTYYHSPLNWLLGLGPGHTIGRLGGWMIWEYLDLLNPLGVTTSRASVAVWTATRESWLGDRSSWFSPLFGWAGIWGDLGFLGLGVYLSFWLLVWRRLCPDELSQYFVLTVVVFGTILSQIEEPGYMLFMTGIIGLRWQEHRNKITLKSS